MTAWDFATDLLVVGSGAGAMTAAFVAKREGLDPLVVEKAARFGGTSARSGGGLWIPNNPLMAEAGLRDSLEQARTYLDATVGDRVPAARKDAFLRHAPGDGRVPAHGTPGCGSNSTASTPTTTRSDPAA